MKILTDPKERNEVCDVFTPPHLRKHIVSWAKASYKKFDAGHLLMQEFNAVGFDIYLYYFIMECPATIYTQCDKPTIAFLQQSQTIGLSYLPKGISALSFPKGIFEFIYVELEPDWIRDMAYNNENIWQIYQAAAAGSKTQINAEPIVIDYMIKQCIAVIKNCKETGVDLLIELKVQILELLNLYRKTLKEKELLDISSSLPYKETLLNIWQKIKSHPDIHLHIFKIPHGLAKNIF